MNESKRGSWRMGLGAALGFVAFNALGNGGLLFGLLLLLIAAALFHWGMQRSASGPSLPRVAQVLERAAQGLRS